MIRIRRLLSGLALAVVSSLAACSDSGRDIETPAYEVVARPAEDLEIRSYGARVAAETEAATATAAFMRLFDYIGGANRDGDEIRMTAPVATQDKGHEIAMTAPVETAQAGANGVRMRFFLPSRYELETAPEPTDPKVRLSRVGARLEAVLRYSGLPLDYRAEARKERLQTLLLGSGWEAVGDVSVYYYDPPWTLPWRRRNEVVQPVEER